jgi:hypothetical protein
MKTLHHILIRNFSKSIRTILVTGLILSVRISLDAQPTFDHQFNYSTTLCHLEKSGDKYFAMDNINNRCILYNMDYTEYRIISLSLPQDYYMYNIQHVSEHTFNADDLIEVSYIYSKYTETATSYYYSYETRIINESGTEIMKIPGAGHTEIIETDDDGRKLMFFIYDFSVLPATTQTLIYSLPGEATKSSDLKSGPRYRIGNPFPNPAPGGITTIPVKLPPGAQKGYVVLYNIYGQEVGRHPVNQGDQEISILPSGTMIPGLYIYNLESGERKSESKKLIIQ